MHASPARPATRLSRHLIAVTLLTTALALAAVPDVHAQTRGWTTSGSKILTPAGVEFAISGVNWYGFETSSAVAHGLWARDYTDILNQIKAYGYNTVRIPFSNQMWESNPFPATTQIAGCPSCAGRRARDILALIVNYAGSIGLHVILDNHRSSAGNSAQENGLWYTAAYPEQAWLRDWISVQEWVNGIRQSGGGADTITVSRFAADGAPIVLGFDLRNEPHTPSSYPAGAMWGSGDGIDPRANPNPNPFAPSCVATSTCLDWRLAAERAGTTLLGEAARNGWAYPLVFVEGVSVYPSAGGTASAGPYDYYWWGGNLLGVNGNATNPGAPVLLNAGGDATTLGPAVAGQVVYSAHDYGPRLYAQPWFNATTCYALGCSSSSLTAVWTRYWAHLSVAGGMAPVWPGHAEYPWANTGHAPVTQAPVYIGEFGTGHTDADLLSTGAGSQGQWMTSIVNFIQSSYAATKTAVNDSGVAVNDLHWTYWAVNGEDSYALLTTGYSGLASAKKEYSFLCAVQQGPLALRAGSSAGLCGSTGPLPQPDGAGATPIEVAPTSPVKTRGKKR